MSVTLIEDEEQSASGSVEDVYRRLRSSIMAGTLPAGAIVNQVTIAHELGVSRTPLREALRMLQAQGFVDAEHQRRMRVAALNPPAIDALYASRIMLEALGVALTVPQLGRDDIAHMRGLLTRIDLEHERGDEAIAAWDGPHNAFHRLQVSGADASLLDAIVTNMDHAHRYRIAYARHPDSQIAARDDHRAIVDAFAERNVERAVYFVARHLARTAIGLLAFLAPDIEPVAVRAALRLTANQTPRPAPARARA